VAKNPIYVIHYHPAIVERQNYIANVDLSPYGLAGQFEQLWLRPVGDGLFELTCIPFCVYGLSLLDQVTVTSDGRFVNTIAKKSGRRVLRILLMDSLGSRLNDLRAAIDAELRRLILSREWQGEKHVVIDVANEADLAVVFSLVGPLADDGDAHWEWGDALAFVPPLTG